MKIKELFEHHNPAQYTGEIEREITGIETDSRKVEPGNIFFALKGEKTHGRNYIEEALEKGAAAIVSDKKYGVQEILEIVVSDPREVLSLWSAAFYRFPSKEMEIIGVTGTNGKTTVSNLIYRILLEQGRAGLIGTSGYFYDSKKGKFSMTTPQPYELHMLFREMLDKGVKKVVMEVSSHALDLKRVRHVEFSSGIFTNLTRDHLDYHLTFENYYLSKFKLFGLLKEQKKENSIINIDDSYGRRMVDDLKYTPATYGIKRDSDYKGETKKLDLKGSEFKVISNKGEESLKVNLLGEFNVYNCLAAIAWAVEGGIDMTTTCRVISEVSPVPGRLEIIKKGGKSDKTIMVDYAHTPNALENVLSMLKKIKAKRLICVFGCGGDRDREKRPLMGRVAGVYSDVVYLTSDNPRTEDPTRILLDIEVGVRDTGTMYYVIPDREEAIKKAIKGAGDGDCILIAGKGDEEFQIVGEKKIPFSDRQVARKYL
ncbi:MAG: UDP-N-acetylmuramoyl-L-alanyl-D-glutamate--2,6-diaminopimelate ligase [Elusimicrobiota bacterium]